MRSFVVVEALVLVLNSDTLLSFTIVHNNILFSVILIAGECIRKDAYGENILTLVGILIQ